MQKEAGGFGVTILDEIQGLFNGAGFFRADLHIHSSGGSHDVKDSSMTPDGIVQTAEIEKLDIIAITDHNEISNVEATIKAG
jgi:predicted metal-dependent phosphoesterase TrpH